VGKEKNKNLKEQPKAVKEPAARMEILEFKG